MKDYLLMPHLIATNMDSVLINIIYSFISLCIVRDTRLKVYYAPIDQC